MTPAKLRLLVVRHGRTVLNREVRFRGLLDVPLDELGQAQARSSARFLTRELGVTQQTLRAIHSSPLSRAIQTASPLAQGTGTPTQIRPEINDVDVGLWQGRLISEVRETEPDGYAVWSERPEEFVFPGGDSLADTYRRVLALLAALRREWPDGGDVALFTHQVPGKLLVSAVMGAGPEAFWRVRLDNGAVTVLEHDGRQGYALTLHNATAHLQDATVEPSML